MYNQFIIKVLTKIYINFFGNKIKMNICIVIVKIIHINYQPYLFKDYQYSSIFGLSSLSIKYCLEDQ